MPTDGDSRPSGSVDLGARVGQRADRVLMDGRAPEVARRDGARTDRGDGAGFRMVERDVDQVRELQERVDQLETALRTQRQISVLVGILAERIGCTLDEAWAVVVRLSQDTNVKVREVARVFCDAFDGRGREEDAELLTRLATSLPGMGDPHRCLSGRADRQ